MMSENSRIIWRELRCDHISSEETETIFHKLLDKQTNKVFATHHGGVKFLKTLSNASVSVNFTNTSIFPWFYVVKNKSKFRLWLLSRIVSLHRIFHIVKGVFGIILRDFHLGLRK